MTDSLDAAALDELERIEKEAPGVPWSIGNHPGIVRPGQASVISCGHAPEANLIVALRNHAGELLRLARLGLRAEPGWIPCGERMPEGKARPLLVCVRDTVEVFQDVWDWTPSMGPLSAFHKHVTHWRELPGFPAPPEVSRG